MYQNRVEAGRKLAISLSQYQGRPQTIVLGIGKGGAVVAQAFARALSLPFNIVLAEPIHMPDQNNLIVGAIAEHSDMWLDEELLLTLQLTPDSVYDQIEAARRRIERLAEFIRPTIGFPDLTEKQVLLVTEGETTGAVLLTQTYSLLKRWQTKVMPIAPVASSFGWQRVQSIIPVSGNRAFCLLAEPILADLKTYYIDFAEPSDAQVLTLLQTSILAT